MEKKSYQSMMDKYRVRSIQMLTMNEKMVSSYGGIYPFLNVVLKSKERDGDFFFGKQRCVKCDENKLILINTRNPKSGVEIIAVGIVTDGGMKEHPTEGSEQYYCHFAVDSLFVLDTPISGKEYQEFVNERETFAHNPLVSWALKDDIIKLIDNHLSQI